MIYLLVLLAKKRHDSKCSLTILLMGAHKHMNGLPLPSLLSSHHTASSQSTASHRGPHQLLLTVTSSLACVSEVAAILPLLAFLVIIACIFLKHGSCKLHTFEVSF